MTVLYQTTNDTQMGMGHFRGGGGGGGGQGAKGCE